MGYVGGLALLTVGSRSAPYTFIVTLAPVIVVLVVSSPAITVLVIGVPSSILVTALIPLVASTALRAVSRLVRGAIGRWTVCRASNL